MRISYRLGDDATFWVTCFFSDQSSFLTVSVISDKKQENAKKRKATADAALLAKQKKAREAGKQKKANRLSAVKLPKKQAPVAPSLSDTEIEQVLDSANSIASVSVNLFDDDDATVDPTATKKGETATHTTEQEATLPEKNNAATVQETENGNAATVQETENGNAATVQETKKGKVNPTTSTNKAATTSPITYKVWEPCTHDLFEPEISFFEESCKAYWKENYKMHGTHCGICSFNLVATVEETKDREQYKVVRKYAMTCKNLQRPEDPCMFIVCEDCWKEKYAEMVCQEEYSTSRRKTRKNH